MTLMTSGTSNFDTFTYTGKDGNSTNTVTTMIDVRDIEHVSYCVAVTSGSAGSLVTTLQCSFDNVTWFSSSSNVVGEGMESGHAIYNQYIRLKVTTAAGTACTISLVINVK